MTEDPTFYSKMAAYGDLDDSELQYRLNVWKSFWIGAGQESAELYKRISSNITKLSLLPEKQIEGLLAESGVTKITQFYSTGLMAGWICHAG